MFDPQSRGFGLQIGQVIRESSKEGYVSPAVPSKTKIVMKRFLSVLKIRK